MGLRQEPVDDRKSVIAQKAEEAFKRRLVKEDVALKAGVDKVEDRDLASIKSAFRGLKVNPKAASLNEAKKSDPQAEPQDLELDTPEEEARQTAIAGALIAGGTGLLGGLLGGAEGAAAGFKQGGAAAKGLFDAEAERNKELAKAEAKAKEKAALASQLVDEKKEARKFAVTQKELDRQLKRDLANQSAAIKAKEKESPDFKTRRNKLTTESKKRFDNVLLARKSISGMAKALAGGSNTFSIAGDNPFTFQLNLFKEALGRMQSGGAINEGEKADFMAMAPNRFDSKKIQIMKLRAMGEEMGSRLQTLGFEPAEVPNFLDPQFNQYLETYKALGGEVPEEERLQSRSEYLQKLKAARNARRRKSAEAELIASGSNFGGIK